LCRTVGAGEFFADSIKRLTHECKNAKAGILLITFAKMGSRAEEMVEKF
jgi:hypothetical protein